MKILWLENNSRFARTVCRSFLAEHEVTVTPIIADARDFLADEAFDVLLVDYDLDDGKGDSLVRALRHKTLRPAIVAVSAHQEGNDALLRAGADATCGKLQFAEIGQVLANLPKISKQ
jgi:DNA-binding response OmpR family regulator